MFILLVETFCAKVAVLQKKAVCMMGFNLFIPGPLPYGIGDNNITIHAIYIN